MPVTNYLASLGAALLLAQAHAAETPATHAVTFVHAHWVQARTGSSLVFVFDQAGAASKGSFSQFTTDLVYDEKSPTTGSLNVKVQVGTVDTQDQERNDMIVSADLFDAQKFPTAQYTADSFSRNAAGGLEAVGKLTLRGVTRDLRLPLKIVKTAAGLELSGETAIRRLDYGVGQGEWKTTEGVGDEVKIQYKVALVRAK
ncbi:MAG TPA: YceI family protein [Steroidobacteraceae bacterium]|nr:YceI family protein [Steroidobacteraceae bacterium]